MKRDVVYILKNDVKPDELRYSLRSICENFKFRDVWFFGGKPEGIEPDHYVFFSQYGKNKWEKATSAYEVIFTCTDMTPEFYLFNDDFFVLKPYKQKLPLVRGTLQNRIDSINKRNTSSYAAMLYETKKMLENRLFDTLDYATHTPFLVNRQKGLETLELFGHGKSFRCLYGNHHKIGGLIRPDVKIQNLSNLPSSDAMLVSTSDMSFRKGRIGEYLRKNFPLPCRYELPGRVAQYYDARHIFDKDNS